MTLLQIIIIIVGFVFLLLTLDLYERKKFNLLHFLVFLGGTGAVVFFIMRPDLLDKFGDFFGIARGADLIVYITIIFLVYLYFELLNRQTKQNIQRTQLARLWSIDHARGNIKKKENDIVFIIPAYHEDETVIHTIKEVVSQGYGVICVDDGENYVDLGKALEKYMDKNVCVVLQHPYNMGQGAALQTGAEYILGFLPWVKYIVHFDADGQHRIEDFQKYKDAFEQDPSLDIVLGSRLLGETKNMPLGRYLHKRLQILFMRLFAGLRLTDTNNGYRMIKRSALAKLRITLNGMAHASEIESLIKQHALKYKEVPVTILYTDYSLAKGQKLSNARNIFKRLIYRALFYK